MTLQVCCMAWILLLQDSVSLSMKTINSQWRLLFSSWNIPKSLSVNALVCFVEKYPLLPSHLLNIKLLEPVDPGGSSSLEFHKVWYAFSEESLLLLRSSSCTILSSFLAPLYLTFLPSILVHQVLSHFPYLYSFTIIVTLSSFMDYFFHSPLKKFKFFHHLEKKQRHSLGPFLFPPAAKSNYSCSP